MTREEREKAIDALKISAPVMAVTQEEFNDYIQTLNKIMNWLEQEPCTDAISRQAVLEVIEKCHCEEWIKADIGAPIEALQPVNPTEKVGHWIDIQYFKADDTYYRPKCPFCSIEPKEYSNYCPNCGAKMSASPIGAESEG